MTRRLLLLLSAAALLAVAVLRRQPTGTAELRPDRARPIGRGRITRTVAARPVEFIEPWGDL